MVLDLIRKQQRMRAARDQRIARSEAITDPDFIFLHLAKNGGGTIWQFLTPVRSQWYHAGHGMSLDDLAERFPGTPITFFVRHPVARYVSGFNNFRRALIQEVTKWPNLAEVNGFRFFRTPDELATSLFSDDERIRSAAEYAMANLAFLRNPLVNNLQSIEVVDKYASTIRFVGLFEHFDASIDGMRRAFGLPPELRVTDSERKGHRAPDTLPKTLSAEGREALLEWYRDDLVIYEHCRTIHEQHMNGLGS